MQSQDQNNFLLEELPPFISLMRDKYKDDVAIKNATATVMREHIKNSKRQQQI